METTTEHKPQRFPTTFEVENLQLLEGLNIRVSYATAENVRKFIKSSEGVYIKGDVREITGTNHDQFPMTSEVHPSIIFFKGIIYCGIVIAGDGSTFYALHDTFFDDKNIKVMATSLLHNVTNDNIRFLVTGNNDPDWRERIIKSLHNVFKEVISNCNLIKLFIRPESILDDDEKLPFLKHLIRLLISRFKLDRIIIPPMDQISGLIFIPHYLSTTGKNELLLMDQSSDYEGILLELKKHTGNK